MKKYIILITFIALSFSIKSFALEIGGIALPEHDQKADKAPSIEPLKIIGVDNRELVDARKGKYLRIGRIRTETGGYCSGALVGPDLVLTAAHCVKKTYVPETFYIGYENGDYLDSATSIRAWVGWSHKEEVNKDWAIIKLDKALGAIWGYFEIEKGFYKFSNMKVVGYGSKWFRGNRMFQQTPCRISKYSKLFDNLFFHTCDTNPGTSGAPIINENNKIVGVHRGGFNEENNSAIGARAFRNKLERVKDY